MRAFGLELSLNARSSPLRRRELTKEERASIVTGRMAGVPRALLATNFECDPSTIWRVCNRFQKNETVESLPRSGRPRKINRYLERYLKRLIKKNPRIS